MDQPKAFISFCSADRALARRLQKDLADAGCISWQFDVSAVPGTDAWETILERIELSDFFLALLSQAATQSRGVTEEISHAHYHSLNNPAGAPRIIPLILEEGVSVPRKILRSVRLAFRDDTYQNDLAALQRSMGIDPSPFQTATALEVTASRSYEFQADAEAARYANSLITNNAAIAAEFNTIAASASEGGARYFSAAQTISASEEVVRYLGHFGPAVSLLKTFWVFFGVLDKHSKGYVISHNIVLQIDSSQDRQFEDVGDERVLRSDCLRLKFEGFRKVTDAAVASTCSS